MFLLVNIWVHNLKFFHLERPIFLTCSNSRAIFSEAKAFLCNRLRSIVSFTRSLYCLFCFWEPLVALLITVCFMFALNGILSTLLCRPFGPVHPISTKHLLCFALFSIACRFTLVCYRYDLIYLSKIF
jgi:hypothetical protein